jgi:cell division protein FtsQ
MRALPSGRSLLVGFAIVLGAVGLYVLARATPMFAVQKIEVVGAPAPVAAHVRAVLSPIEGSSLLALSSAEIAQRLAQLPDVVTGSYNREFPHTLRVTVRAEHPVAIARRGVHAWLVASSTRAIAEVPLHTRPGLPRIWLAHSRDPEVGQPVTDRFALRAVRALALARTSRFHLRIRMVRVQQRDLTFLLASGVQLRLGELQAVRLKLAVAERILPGLLAQGRFTYLDVGVPERPVADTTLNPQPKP